MRCRAFETEEQYAARVKPWHLWFAWHPVRINDEYVWLEHVERTGHRVYFFGAAAVTEWTYRHRAQTL